MEPFETWIAHEGNVMVQLMQSKVTFLLDSPEGTDFAQELLPLITAHYPSLIPAVEQRLKLINPKLFSAMKLNRHLYLKHVVDCICSCCFGELGPTLDYDGEVFRMEYPRQCRNLKLCPWNGYATHNKDSFCVICGAKREFGLTKQERRVALLIKQGYTAWSLLADVMQCSESNIHKLVNHIHTKTATKGMADLVHLLNKIEKL